MIAVSLWIYLYANVGSLSFLVRLNFGMNRKVMRFALRLMLARYFPNIWMLYMPHDVFWWITDFGYLAVVQIFCYDWSISDLCET